MYLRRRGLQILAVIYNANEACENRSCVVLVCIVFPKSKACIEYIIS